MRVLFGSDDGFVYAVKAKDANGMTAVYSDDAVSNPPNSPPLVGNAAIKKSNADLLKIPGEVSFRGNGRYRKGSH